MATKDTVVQELVINTLTQAQFDAAKKAGTLSPYELYGTPDTSVRLPVLTPMWFEHITNDVSWLRADTFSWQSGDMYVAAYNHLLNDLKEIGCDYGWLTTELEGACTTIDRYPEVGAEVYTYSSGATGTLVQAGLTVVSYDKATDELVLSDGTICTCKSYSIPAKRKQTETIGDTTITCYRMEDGHKICLPDQESNLIALYEATGSAWYYILDTENKQFKLPRELPREVPFNERAPIYGNTARQGDGNGAKGAPLLASTDNVSGSKGITTGGSSGTAGAEFYVGFQQIENAYADVSTTRIASNGAQKHLYFYVGHFEQDSVEQTAGINAETFNGKADRNLMNTSDNVDIVIESQLPTAENGYTWYRKYKSGWVEQGGDAGSLGTTATNITLPVTMANIEYYANANYAGQTSVTSVYAVWVDTITQTGFRVRASNSTSVNACKWYVCGMAAA